MDPDVIAGMDCLTNAAKERYFRLTGYEPRPLSRWPHLWYLVREFFYTWKVMGLRYALSRLVVLKGRKGSA